MMQDDGMFDEILKNPNKFGLPTFGQFKKNPDKFRRTANSVMETIFKSLPVARKALVKQEYKVTTLDKKVYTTKSLEEVERILKNEGLTILDCKWAPQVIELVGLRFKMVVEMQSLCKAHRISISVI